MRRSIRLAGLGVVTVAIAVVLGMAPAEGPGWERADRGASAQASAQADAPAASVSVEPAVPTASSGPNASAVPTAFSGPNASAVPTASSGPGSSDAPLSAADTSHVPLLIVPGWGDGMRSVEPLRQRFLDEGWRRARVTALQFEDPFGSNEAHADEIARAVEALRAVGGVERVDLIAHSMGGLAVRHYLHFGGGAERVRRVVFLGTPHRGTMAAMLAWGEGGREMVPGSDFLTRLNGKSAGVPDDIEALAIRTPSDLRVIPASSAILAGALNLEICCPSHHELLDGESRVFEVAARFLSEGAEGVPSAAVPSDRIQWTDERFEDRLGSWSLFGDEAWTHWGDGPAEEMIRRWFFPSWPPGETGGGGG